MKRSFFLYLLMCLLAACSPERPFENPGVYGTPPREMPATSVNEIITRGAEFEGKEVLVEGITGSVCENRGCWMYVEEGEARIRVVFKDYAFFVPKDSEGKRVRAFGSVGSRVVSKETLQHWAEEEKGGDPSSIRGDSTVIMLTAYGVAIENGGELSVEQKEMMSDNE